MIDIRFDFSEFERKARAMDVAIDQVPYALSTLLNDAARETRRYLVDTVWPSNVTVRNQRFLGVALRTRWATKTDLSVEIFDSLGRAHLQLHAKGGSKQARGNFAIPIKGGAVQRTAKGVRASQQPRNLKRAVRIRDVIYQEVGRGRNKQLRPLFVLRPAVRQPKDVPFYEEFEISFRANVRRGFAGAMMKAMRGRR